MRRYSYISKFVLLITKSLQTVSKRNRNNAVWLLMLASTISVLLMKLLSNIITWRVKPLFAFKVRANCAPIINKHYGYGLKTENLIIQSKLFNRCSILENCFLNILVGLGWMCGSVEPRWAGFLAHLLFPRFPSSLLPLHRQAGSPGPPRAVHHPSPQGCGKRGHTEHAYGIPTYALPRTVVTFRMTFTPPSYTHSSLRDPPHPPCLPP